MILNVGTIDAVIICDLLILLFENSASATATRRLLGPSWSKFLDVSTSDAQGGIPTLQNQTNLLSRWEI